MNNREELHSLLVSIAGPNVYYQIPSNIVMRYPAIKYEKNRIDNKYADDSVYYQKTSYSITVISKVVDDLIVDRISKLPGCSFDREFIVNNLYHDVFNMHY